MAQTILVPENLDEQLRAFVRSEGVPLEIVHEGEAALRVVRCEGRVESDDSTLQSGGWITCPTARAIARKLGVHPRKVGRLLDILDIKVRDCELGCF